MARSPGRLAAALALLSFVACIALVTRPSTATALHIDIINPYNNIASEIRYYTQTGGSLWTTPLQNEIIAALNILGGTVYTLTPVQFNFIWATNLDGATPITVVPKFAYGYNADNFKQFYCNNPTGLLGTPLLCYPGITASYMTNAANVTNHFVGYDIYLASGPGLTPSSFALTPTASKYYLRAIVLQALLRAVGYDGTLLTTPLGFNTVPQRLTSTNCPLCVSVYDSLVTLANGTKLFNTWTRPQNSGALAVLFDALLSSSTALTIVPKADEPDTTAALYLEPGLYYPGYSVYTWTTNPLRAPGVGPNPGSYQFVTSGANPIGLVGTTIVSPPTLNTIETYVLRQNGLYSYACGTAVTCGSCNAIAGCGWCELSNFCVDTFAEQPCPDPEDAVNFDHPCNVCTSVNDCNPSGVHPECYTSTCLENTCNVTLLPGTSCTVDGNACNLGQCSTTGTCVVSGLCDNGSTCTTSTCTLVMGVPTCTYTPIVPSTNCGACTVPGDCAAPSFPGCVNVTCLSGQCSYQPLTGTTCNPSNSCYANSTCSATGTCVPKWTYLTNTTFFGCPTLSNACYELQCVGTGGSPSCTQIPIPAPSPCYTCNNSTGQFAPNACPAAPAGQTDICIHTSGVAACEDVLNGCNANSDCDTVCAATPAVCNVNICNGGSCECNVTRTCQNQCWGCSIFTNDCALLNGHDLNQCGTCVSGNPCCSHPDCDNARLVNGLIPPAKKRAALAELFVESDDDDTDNPAWIIESGVQITCQPGVRDICQFTFVVYTHDATEVVIADPTLNFVTFDGQVQTNRSPPETIIARTDDTRGTVYRVTTHCSTNVGWSLFAFGQWLNISSGSAGRQLVDSCGVCNGDNVCASCNNNGNECIACQCTSALLDCRATDQLSCQLAGPCSYATCDPTLDIGDMCMDNLVPEGTVCDKRGHLGVCNSEGTCIFDSSWSSSSSSYPYYSLSGPEHDSPAAHAGITLLIIAICFLAVLVPAIVLWRNSDSDITVFYQVKTGLHLGDYALFTYHYDPNLAAAAWVATGGGSRVIQTGDRAHREAP